MKDETSAATAQLRFVLVLAIGFAMGVVTREGGIEPVGYAGSGKILEVG